MSKGCFSITRQQVNLPFSTCAFYFKSKFFIYIFRKDSRKTEKACLHIGATSRLSLIKYDSFSGVFFYSAQYKRKCEAKVLRLLGFQIYFGFSSCFPKCDKLIRHHKFLRSKKNLVKAQNQKWSSLKVTNMICSICV